MHLEYQLPLPRAEISGPERKERQDKSFKHVAITSEISSQCLDNRLHLDFNSITAK